MKISNITQEHDLSIQIVSKSNTIELPISLVKTSTHGLVANPISYNGKQLSFNNRKDTIVKYNLLCSFTDRKPYIWKNVCVNNAMVNGNRYVVFKIKGEGILFNRRCSYRLPLDIKCKMPGYGETILHYTTFLAAEYRSI